MATTSQYCKAYPRAVFASSPEWAAARPALDGAEEPDVLFLHDNYVVTAGIYVDEDVVFAEVTPSWMAFCEQTLEFAVPDDARIADDARA